MEPVEALRQIAAEDEDLINLILRAFLARRSILIEVEAGVKLVGSRYSHDTRRLREFLARNRVPYRWMDLESDAEAEVLLQALAIAPCETPIVLGGEGVLRNPSNAQLAAMLGLHQVLFQSSPATRFTRKSQKSCESTRW